VSPNDKGGILALVNNGDMIQLDVPNRKLTLRFLRRTAKRRKEWKHASEVKRDMFNISKTRTAVHLG
jgi:dihydroxyacid dehydratase/phosphogluconate dehydratase